MVREYKDSGITWIGSIPKEWKKERSLEAWDDIHKIVEIFENEHYDYPEDRIKTIIDIEEILKNGGWL